MVPSRLLLCPLLLLAPACGATQSTPREPDVYTGCATDETWRLFDDYETTNRVTTDPAASPQWDQPASGASLPASSPATLSWQPTATLPGNPAGNSTCAQMMGTMSVPSAGVRAAPRPLPQPTPTPQHLPPVSGRVFDLHFRSGGSEIYRVITTRQQLPMNKDVWAAWAGQTVSVDLFEASLLQNQVVDDGPYQGPSLSFQVTP